MGQLKVVSFLMLLCPQMNKNFRGEGKRLNHVSAQDVAHQSLLCTLAIYQFVSSLYVITFFQSYLLVIMPQCALSCLFLYSILSAYMEFHHSNFLLTTFNREA